MRYEQHIDLRTIGRVVAAMPEFHRKRKVAVALAMRELLAATKPYVSVSGGKDSVAVLGVAAEAARLCNRTVVAWAHVSDASFPGTEETIEKACRVAGVELHVDRSPVSAFAVYGHGGADKFGKEGYFFDAIRIWIERGYDLAFTGVRAAESRRRTQAAKAHGTAYNTSVPAQHRKCEPLAWWSIEDVAAAIRHYGMPIHPIYEKRCLSGVPIRLGYVTAADWAADQAQFLRTNYPQQFARLAAVAPEVRNHV
jgi:3'-phosphoadenosine 5'-phosphosulfate sulfotransferase (PAPS reductase)/FAD synthetase